MAAKKKVTAKKATASKKKASPAKAKKVKASEDAPKQKKAAASASDLASLDRKALSARAREIKRELLAIRFNLQSPSLSDYRKKKKELSKVLGHLS